MKVVLFTHNASGGLVQYISQLANALASRIDIVVFGPIDLDPSRFPFSPEVRIRRFHVGNVVRTFFTNTLLFWRPIRFLRAIRSEAPDLLHFNGVSPWYGLLLPILSRRYPIVVTVHDVVPHAGSRAWDQELARSLFLRYADAVIVHGEWARRQLDAPIPTYVIPHGDYSFFTGLGGEEPVDEEDAVLFFGRIEEYKGLRYLLEAMPLVWQASPATRLIIAGAGDLSPYADLLGDGRIELVNRFIEDAEVPVLFQRAMTVVLPYIEGTQTGVIPIAYAFSRPVIVTDVGSIPEVVEDGRTGYIVPPRDPEALADAILKLLQKKPLRIIMGTAAREKMTRELSWGPISERTIAAYREVMERWS
ncbi:MAG TPA: glycosyltransferase family 4 protein [Methanoregulaceae archaeon]|nr:glycosyltransferase family 4 protein [Methanoregulaceae archaeon]HQJ87340.1 glycosyltransferase family 4 protein [Methanoregulaceae archaeon]